MSPRRSSKSPAAAAPSAALPPSPPPALSPATLKLPPLDPALLLSSATNLQDSKRAIIHSIAAVADRIPNLIPLLARAVTAIDLARDTIAYALASLPEEVRQ